MEENIINKDKILVKNRNDWDHWKKCGMTRVFTDDGKSVPVTIIQANPNQINRIKTLESDGYNAIQVTANQASPKITKPVKGQFSKSKITPRATLHEFRIDDHESEQVETGREIKVNYFKKGELVDVIGKTIGKGFAGVIKRHNFSMQDATHGNSLAHRAPGSIGQNQTPGRVFKGKKMSGQMGNVTFAELPLYGFGYFGRCLVCSNLDSIITI